MFDGGAGCGRFSILLAKHSCEVTHFDKWCIGNKANVVEAFHFSKDAVCHEVVEERAYGW